MVANRVGKGVFFLEAADYYSDSNFTMLVNSFKHLLNWFKARYSLFLQLKFRPVSKMQCLGDQLLN